MNGLATKERLARALEAALCPPWMVTKARAGGYDDYESDSPTPIHDLVVDLRGVGGQKSLIKAAMNGEFDGTKEEADAWAASPEVRAIFAEFVRRPRPGRER